MKSKLARKLPLAWMQPGASRRRQILSVVLVQDLETGPNTPAPLYFLKMNLAGTLEALVKRAEEAGQVEAKGDLIARLEGMGLLQADVNPETPTPEMAQQILSMDNEVKMHLGPKGVKVERLEEIPGARGLLEALTLQEWMEALEAEVQNPE